MLALIASVLSGLAVLCSYRVAVGPSVVDRVAASQAVMVMLSMIMLLMGLHYGISQSIDVLLVYSILLFADVLIIAKYLEGRELHR